METLQNGLSKLAAATTKPAVLPHSNGVIVAHLNSLFEAVDLGNMDPSRAFVSKVKRLIVKVLLIPISLTLCS
ncbi:delta-1-pyrroline-5-carboxylate synthetase [Sesbania bispinosa]|nr:delta-1-pyrroline-5-carboxylate synthetase [Sesbania bispinosa]